jgi:dihydrofolate reductase
MGKLIIQQFTSMDGFAAEPDGGLRFMEQIRGWTGINDANRRLLEDCSAILLGRVTYSMFTEYWPGADPQEESVAEPINRLPKYVVSTTLDRATWGDGEAQIIGQDIAARIRALKESSGDVIVWGSLTLTELLFSERLVDEVYLHVLPSVLGEGRPAYPPSAAGARFSLLGAHMIPPGDVASRYAVVTA